MIAAELAAAYDAAVKYAAERAMSQFDAMVHAAKEGQQQGDRLPRQVLADYLEENNLHADDDTLRHLRSDDDGIAIGRLNVRVGSTEPPQFETKIEAKPHLPEAAERSTVRRGSNHDEINTHWRDFHQDRDDWQELSPEVQRHYTDLVTEHHAATDRLQSLPYELREMAEEQVSNLNYDVDFWPQQVNEIIDDIERTAAGAEVADDEEDDD